MLIPSVHAYGDGTQRLRCFQDIGITKINAIADTGNWLWTTVTGSRIKKTGRTPAAGCCTVSNAKGSADYAPPLPLENQLPSGGENSRSFFLLIGGPFYYVLGHLLYLVRIQPILARFDITLFIYLLRANRKNPLEGSALGGIISRIDLGDDIIDGE